MSGVIKVDEIEKSSDTGTGIKLNSPLQDSSGNQLISETGAISNVDLSAVDLSTSNTSTFSDDQISGDKIHGGTISGSTLNSDITFPDGHWVPLGLVQGNSSDNRMIFDNVFSDDYLYFKIYFQIMPSALTQGGDLYFRYRKNGADLSNSSYYGRTVFDGYGGTSSAAITALTYYNLWTVGLWSQTNKPIMNGEYIFSQVSNPVINGSTRFGSYYRPYGIGSCFGYAVDTNTGYGRSDSNIRYNVDLNSSSLPDGFVIYTSTSTDRLSTNSYVYAWGMKP